MESKQDYASKIDNNYNAEMKETWEKFQKERKYTRSVIMEFDPLTITNNE